MVGSLVGGILVGPALLGWVEMSPFLEIVAEIGVILLMFNALVWKQIFKVSLDKGKKPF